MDFIDRIDPELRDGLALYEALGLAEQDLSGDRIPALRAQSSAVLAAAMADIAPNGQVIREDRTAPSPAGDVPVRIYRPVDAGPALPCLVWMHGGGMIFGTLDAEDLTCEAYASVVGCVVVSVDYRLAPEHPHPAPVEDCYAALLWAGEHADDLGIDAARVAIGGSSAGGGLAAGTALLARDRGGPRLAFQLLVYPMLDDRDATPSTAEFPGILSWSREHNRSGWAALLGARAGGEDVDQSAAPARATDLSGLPPALIQVGELEVFRDEDIDYAARLLRAGVPTQLHVYPGAFHAADLAAPMAGTSMRMAIERMDALRAALHPRPVAVPSPAAAGASAATC
jgi:acetyl esterase/lipase